MTAFSGTTSGAEREHQHDERQRQDERDDPRAAPGRLVAQVDGGRRRARHGVVAAPPRRPSPGARRRAARRSAVLRALVDPAPGQRHERRARRSRRRPSSTSASPPRRLSEATVSRRSSSALAPAPERRSPPPETTATAGIAPPENRSWMRLPACASGRSRGMLSRPCSARCSPSVGAASASRTPVARTAETAGRRRTRSRIHVQARDGVPIGAPVHERDAPALDPVAEPREQRRQHRERADGREHDHDDQAGRVRAVPDAVEQEHAGDGRDDGRRGDDHRVAGGPRRGLDRRVGARDRRRAPRARGACRRGCSRRRRRARSAARRSSPTPPSRRRGSRAR